ncbi:alpha-L-arabinofuranosidase C-terminal domain-containing protein [Leeuwenhoekiella marinoflava]|uniref:non-reducing end alpha-L-arabinofuranosidase n=2 Tax=Leeuwenhoekiella marinoflava TaxID=988 RepID=A0A4Q0PRV3_9FLAO|nr:alpha-L-arabinofuranosidase C-terminal domain-containing protein [Leeuwenhoekiella marinoflava]RXG32645.1 alpha-N-arabinofuranosidase [Leeuwenhoekiella marinoflava]SHE51925.1 alpha-N-arabinofuranosidase [Leeuwenhoekiella marinoflava DSM 3653]
MKKRIYFFLSLIILIGCNVKDKGDKVKLLSPQVDVSFKEAGWETEYWSNQENYSDTTFSDSESQVLAIYHDTLQVGRIFKKVEVKPYSHYKVTGFIKTENVSADKSDAGAGFDLDNFKIKNDTVFTGKTDWTPVTMEFDSEGDDSFIISCFLGKNGPAKGKAFFKDIQVEEISSTVLKPAVAIDITKEKEPMSPYIYGQFIEHMGKSIYGGLWAEMLTDRKFYHKPGTSVSPWKTELDTNQIVLNTSNGFSEMPLPVFSLKNGKILLKQDSIALLKDKSYTGRLVFKAKGTIEEIKLSLISENIQKEKQLEFSKNEFVSIPFEFATVNASEQASFQIEFTGSGSVTLAAVSLMPSDNIEGFRSDVIALLKELDAPIYRWPGGNFVSGYDWKDGLGNPDARPTRYERAWDGLEYNDVGIHEFMKLCEILDVEANIAVNTGLGDAELAANEVAYFNSDTSTKMGEWRAENGHAEPYNVKLWAVGNEMFGDWQLGHMPIEDYVKKHNKVAEAMWAVDPDIDLIAVGFPGEWNDMMYSNCAENMTYISEHFYRQDWHAGGLLTHVKQMPDAIRDIAEEHKRARREIPEIADQNIRIALDEWNYWYGPHEFGLLGTRYFLRDALGIAAGLNEFSRQSDMYYMANYAQTVNVIGAIKTTQTDSWLEGTGLVLKIYRKEFGARPIAITGTPEPLDIAATLTEDGEYLTLSVVNATHKEYELNLDFLEQKIAQQGQAFIITGENDMVYNDVENKERIYLLEDAFTLQDNALRVRKESAGIYKFKLN